VYRCTERVNNKLPYTVEAKDYVQWDKDIGNVGELLSSKQWNTRIVGKEGELMEGMSDFT
jgi:hypothetical protein